MRRLRAVVLALLIASTFTCGDSTTSMPALTGPGWLPLQLQTSATDAGGVLVTIRGGAVDSVRSAIHDVFSKRVGPLTKVAVAGNLASGVIAEIFVPDTQRASNYSASVDQAAAQTLEQHDVADYEVSVGGP
jgi:hypothetical protein